MSHYKPKGSAVPHGQAGAMQSIPRNAARVIPMTSRAISPIAAQVSQYKADKEFGLQILDSIVPRLFHYQRQFLYRVRPFC